MKVQSRNGKTKSTPAKNFPGLEAGIFLVSLRLENKKIIRHGRVNVMTKGLSLFNKKNGVFCKEK